jgi:RNA polymerase sigma-70 factor (ECF subfamily)
MVVSEMSVAGLDLESFRPELTGYCYRMLGSGFEGRSSVRSWLYRIATNVCIDMHRHVQRRARPMDMGPSSAPDESLLGSMLPEQTWVQPMSDARTGAHSADPAEVAQYRESIRLAFVAMLQYLPARQRAAMVLCEVLRWPVAEVAELLDTSVAAVNSALQRARSTLRALPPESRPEPLDGPDARLLERYVDAFERYDIQRLVTLLHDDAVQSMPPFALWIRGSANIGRWMQEPGPSHCQGSRLIATSANGCPAFAQYRPDPSGGFTPWAMQVLEISRGAITAMNFFLDTERLFPQFGVPSHLDG